MCVHGRCLLNKLTARETKGDECRSFSRATTPTFRRNNGSTVVAKIPPHIESQRIIKRKRSRRRRKEKRKREHGIMERRHARGPRGTGTENYTVDLIKARGSYGGSTRNFVRGLKVSNDGRKCLVLGFFTSAFGLRFLFGGRPPRPSRPRPTGTPFSPLLIRVRPDLTFPSTFSYLITRSRKLSERCFPSFEAPLWGGISISFYGWKSLEKFSVPNSGYELMRYFHILANFLSTRFLFYF